MNRFGKRDRNDFFGDAYEKAKPVSLNTGKGKDYLDEPEKGKIETSKVRPSAEKTAPVNQERSREKYSLDEPAKDIIEPRKQPVTEKIAPVNQDKSRERYSLDEPAKDIIEPRKQPITEKTVPVRQDKSRSRDTDEQEDLFIPRRRQPAEQSTKSPVSGSTPQRSYPKELKPTVSAAPKSYDRPPARGGSGGGGQNKKGKTSKRRIPIGFALLLDVLAAGLLFFFFFQANFADVANKDSDDQTPTETVSETMVPSATTSVSATPTASTKQSTQPSTQPSATAAASIDPNNWRAKFADKFSTDGKVHTQSTDGNWTYQSANVDVNITKHTDNGVVYFVTDIYIADIKYFKTSFGDGPDKENTREFVYTALQKVNGIVGVNGDYYPRNGGLTIRNGQYITYTKTSDDELVMYNDGTMKAFANNNFDYQSIKSQAPDKVYQVWGFGPMLLDGNGQPLTKFNSTLTGADNPRTAIGYYEPGHYCFVTVDGRQQGYSYPGYSISQLANLMHTLGCRIAFNLDGGGSSQLAFNGKEINKPCPDTYRKDYDILYITDQG